MRRTRLFTLKEAVAMVTDDSNTASADIVVLPPEAVDGVSDCEYLDDEDSFPGTSFPNDVVGDVEVHTQLAIDEESDWGDKSEDEEEPPPGKVRGKGTGKGKTRATTVKGKHQQPQKLRNLSVNGQKQRKFSITNNPLIIKQQRSSKW